MYEQYKIRSTEMFGNAVIDNERHTTDFYLFWVQSIAIDSKVDIINLQKMLTLF